MIRGNPVAFSGASSGLTADRWPGARLFVVPVDPVPARSGPLRASSDADGRFDFDAPDMTYTEIDGLPARRQGMLIATADGYMPDWVATWGSHGVRLITTAVRSKMRISLCSCRAKMCRYMDDCLITWGDRSRELAYDLPHSWSPGSVISMRT